MERKQGKRNSRTQVMEVIWLLIALISLISAIHALAHHVARKGVIFFILMILSLAMFYLRRHLRIHDNKKDL
ncbi:MAG: hypothetical protein GXO83_11190 [Chlorobi bacterium]|nr:hypothetical protein [Chlorobiota bacterium]